MGSSSPARKWITNIPLPCQHTCYQPFRLFYSTGIAGMNFQQSSNAEHNETNDKLLTSPSLTISSTSRSRTSLTHGSSTSSKASNKLFSKAVAGLVAKGEKDDPSSMSDNIHGDSSSTSSVTTPSTVGRGKGRSGTKPVASSAAASSSAQPESRIGENPVQLPIAENQPKPTQHLNIGDPDDDGTSAEEYKTMHFGENLLQFRNQ